MSELNRLKAIVADEARSEEERKQAASLILELEGQKREPERVSESIQETLRRLKEGDPPYERVFNTPVPPTPEPVQVKGCVEPKPAPALDPAFFWEYHRWKVERQAAGQSVGVMEFLASLSV